MSSEHAAERSQRWARRVLEAFRDAGLSTDAKVGDAGGPSTTTLTRYRNAAVHGMPFPSPRDDVFGKIDAAAGWRPGSARALWVDGTEPVAADPRDPDVDAALKRMGFGHPARFASWPSAAIYSHLRNLGPETAADLFPLMEALVREVQQLQDETMELRDELQAVRGHLGMESEIDERMAARRVTMGSKASQIRAAQDAAGEENQDTGEQS